MRKITSYVSLYFCDPEIRFKVGILFGLILNSVYIIFNLIYGIKYENVWSVAVAVYYALIVFMRYFAIDEEYGEKAGETSDVLGILMLILSFPMTGMIIYTVITDSNGEYPRSSLPIFAAYAIFSICRAVYGLISSKKRGLPSRSNAHIIRLSLALMSLYNLQTSLLFFIGVGEKITLFSNFLTGGAVSLSMLALASGNLKGKKP